MSPGRIAVGLALVGVGVVSLLSALDVVDGSDAIGSWWPIAIVLLGLSHAFARRKIGGAPGAITATGLVLLGVTTGVFGSDAWSVVWPAALIVTGLWVIVEWGRGRESRVGDHENLDGLAVLSATRLATRSQVFSKATLTSVLGSVTLDLSKAAPASGASVSATAVLGSIDIIVPRGWQVTVRGLPLLGTWDDTTDRTASTPEGPSLVVHALVVLGGIEVKHPRRWS